MQAGLPFDQTLSPARLAMDGWINVPRSRWPSHGSSLGEAPRLLTHPPTASQGCMPAITHKPVNAVKSGQGIYESRDVSHIASLMLRFRDNHHPVLWSIQLQRSRVSVPYSNTRINTPDMICYLLSFLISPCTYALLSGVITITILHMTQNHAASKTHSCSEKRYTATLEKRQKSPFVSSIKPPRQHPSPKLPRTSWNRLVVATLSSFEVVLKTVPCLT